MTKTEQRLKELGIELPVPLKMPPGVVLPFPWVRSFGRRVLISGHGPTTLDGSLAQPLGKLGAELTLEQGYEAALIVKVFGPEVGSHARSAVGLAELPFRIPVEIEGEVELRE